MFHPEVESYLIIQSLSKDKTRIVKNKDGNEFVASNIDSIMLSKKYVIICNSWFLLHVHSRFRKQIIKLLKRSGINEKDIAVVESALCDKIYVTQNPESFIPCLMKFEELLSLKK